MYNYYENMEKELVYSYYIRIVDEIKPYEKITIKNMIEEVLKQYSDIYDRLELKQYGTNYKDLIDSTSNNAKTLNVGDINITVTGDLSKASIEDLTDAIDKELKYISNNL